MPRKLLRFFLPRLEYILLGAVFIGVAASGPRLLNFDGDLPRHILTGSLILQSHQVSTTDIFSFRTVGSPSIPHEWLAQVLFALAYHWLGLDGIVIVTALIIIFTWSMVYYRAMHQSNSLFSALIFTALAVGASQIHVLPRPHIFTYLLTAIWLVLLDRMDENKAGSWWSLPLVMLVWVNLHGMFVIGLIIWGIYLMGDFMERPSREWFAGPKAKALMIGGVLSLSATLFSPSGIHIWTAIASLGSNTYITSRIPEYQSADFHMPETWPFLLILILLIMGLGRTSRRFAWTDILLAASFTALALYTSRMIPLFGIVVAPLAARAFARWTQGEYPQSRWFTAERNIQKINSSSNGVVWLLVIIITFTLLFRSGPTVSSGDKQNIFSSSFFPVEAVAWLRKHPQSGHMFNEFDWGGYLLLELWPAHQIFMDGHTHIYGEELTREYEKVKILDESWQSILNKYDITWAIIRPNEPLADALQEELGWEIVYQDRTATILARE